MYKSLAQIDFERVQNIGLPNFRYKDLSLGDLITAAIPYLFTIAGLLLLLYLIYGGFQLMVSRGDPKGTEAAKSKITNALVGFVVIFMAYWIVRIFGQILGINTIFS